MVLDIVNKRIEFILDGEWIKINSLEDIAQQVNDAIKDWAFKLAIRYWTVYNKKHYLPDIKPYQFLFNETIQIIDMNKELDYNRLFFSIDQFLKVILENINEIKENLLTNIGYYLANNRDHHQEANRENLIQFKSDLRRKRFNDCLLNKNFDILKYAIEIFPEDNTNAKLEFQTKPQFNQIADIWNEI